MKSWRLVLRPLSRGLEAVGEFQGTGDPYRLLKVLRMFVVSNVVLDLLTCNK